jgi:hypothetical protein
VSVRVAKVSELERARVKREMAEQGLGWRDDEGTGEPPTLVSEPPHLFIGSYVDPDSTCDSCGMAHKHQCHNIMADPDWGVLPGEVKR